MRIMTFQRKHLALLAAVFVALLVVAGVWFIGQQKAHATATTAAPSASSDEDDSSAGQTQAGDAATPSIAAIPAGPMSGPAPAVKVVHSPDKVARDLTLSTGQCQLRTIDAGKGAYLPDPACTPGAIDPAVTQDNLGSTICKSGYTTTVRAPASETNKVKALSLQQYGQTPASSTEFDHLISLQLGGTNAVSNLWPEPNRAGAPGTTNPKDAIETRLNKAVCAHKVTLADAQKAIARNWVTAEKDLGL